MIIIHLPLVLTATLIPMAGYPLLYLPVHVVWLEITAADILADLAKKLHQGNMDICFAEMKGPVKDILKRYGLFDSFGTENFFPTIGQAVDRYLEMHKVNWRDWDDPAPGINI